MSTIRELYDNVNWNRFWVSVWYGWIAAFALMEGFALLHQRVNPPLTHVIVDEVPWWVTVPFLVWLLVHFASRYAKHPIL